MDTIDAKLSPFIKNIPESTSPSGSNTMDKEIGSDTIILEKDTATQSEDNLDDIKFNESKEQILIQRGEFDAIEKHDQGFSNQSERAHKRLPRCCKRHDCSNYGRSQRQKCNYCDRKKTRCIDCISITNSSYTMDVKLSPIVRNVPRATSPRKFHTKDKEVGSETVLVTKDMTTQSNVVDDLEFMVMKQHYILNKEGDYKALEKHNKYSEKSDRDNKKFSTCRKEHEDKNYQANKLNLDSKGPSIFTRKLKNALRRGSVKKTESKSTTNTTLGEVTRHLGISTASDPPSGTSTPQSLFSNPFKTDTSKKNDNNYVKKKVLREEKEKKKFFSFRKKNKCKDIDEGRIIFKNSFTTGRCEVTNGLAIRTGSKSSNHIQNFNANVDQKENTLQTPSAAKDNIKETRFNKTPTHFDSRNSVTVIWNNKIYTSSSKVFELMNNVCRKSGIALQSKREVTQRQIEAWLVLKTNDTQSQKHKLDKTNEKCIEVKVFDEKWILDKTKAFCHEIEIILHSNKVADKDVKQDSSEYIRIDIPKGFFVDSDQTSCESNNSRHDVFSAEKVYKITEYDTENYGRKEKNIFKSCKKDHKQNSVNVKKEIAHDVRNRILEKSKTPMRRDIVLEDSHIVIPRHDFIGVGIVNHRGIWEIPNPSSTQCYGSSEEETEQDLQFHRRCQLAKNYLQEYYNPQIPDIGLISISEYYPFQCRSDISIESYLYNQNEETVSCPTVFDNFDNSRHETSIFDIGHIIMPSFACCWFDKFIQTRCGVKKNIKQKRGKEADTNISTRMNPKDSIEVYNRRKLYALSNKSKWKVGVKLPNPCCPNMSEEAKVVASRSSNDTKCCQQKKRVYMLGSHDIIIKKRSDRMPEGIITFKNNPPCQVKKQEYCKINHTTAHEPSSCRNTCEQMENPLCSNSKTSCEEMLLCQCCAGMSVKSSKENSTCCLLLCPDTSLQYPEACKPQAYAAPSNDCTPEIDANTCPNVPLSVSDQQTPSGCNQSKINNNATCLPDIPTCQQPCPAVFSSCNSQPCPSKNLPCNTLTSSTAPTNCNHHPFEISQPSKINRQSNLNSCHSLADEKISSASCKEVDKLPCSFMPHICTEVPPSGIAPSCEKGSICAKQSSCGNVSCSEKSSTCNSNKSPCCQYSPCCGIVSPYKTAFCPGKEAIPCDESPVCVKAISCKTSPTQKELPPCENIFKKVPCQEILPTVKRTPCKESPSSCKQLPRSGDTCEELPCAKINSPCEQLTQCEEIATTNELCETPSTHCKEPQSKSCKMPCDDTSISGTSPACIPCKTISHTPSKMPSSMAVTPSPTASKMLSPIPCGIPSPPPCGMPSPASCKMLSRIPSKMPSPMPCKMPSSILCKMPSCRPNETCSNVPRNEPSTDPSLRLCHKQMSLTSQETPPKAFSEPRSNYSSPYPLPCKHILLPPPCSTQCERYPCSHRFEGFQIRGSPFVNHHSITESSNTCPETRESCPDESDTCHLCRPCYFTTEPTPYIQDPRQDSHDLCSYTAHNPNQHIFNQPQLRCSPSNLQCNTSTTILKSCDNYSLAASYSHPSPDFSCHPAECSHNPQFVKGKWVTVSSNMPYPSKSPSNSAPFISNDAPCLCMDSSYKNENIESLSSTYITSPYIITARKTLNPSRSSCKATLCTSSQTVSHHFDQFYENSTERNAMHSNYVASGASAPCKSSSTRTNNTPFCYKKLIPPFKFPYLQCRKQNNVDFTKEASVLDANRYIDAEQNWIKCESDCAMRQQCSKSCNPAPSSSTVHELKRYESYPRSEAISEQNTEQNSDSSCSPRSLYPLSPPIYPKPMKLTGVHIRILPSSRKICSSDCNTWVPARRDKTLALNAEEKIIIRFKKVNCTNEVINDGFNIKVQDENGITLYERKEKGNYKQSPVRDKNNGLLEDIYKDSHVNRLATSLDGDYDRNILKEKKSNASTIEIRIKLQVDKDGDQTTENRKASIVIVGDDKTSGQPKGLEDSQVEDNKMSSEKCKNNTNDIIICIIIRTSISSSTKGKLAKGGHYLHTQFSEQIAAKFHSVSIGHSDIIEKDTSISVHRATLNLASVEKMGMHSEEIIRNVILTPDSNENKTKISTKSYICIIGKKPSKIETQSIASKTDINRPNVKQTRVSGEKVQIKVERQENSISNINISNTTSKEKYNGSLVEEQYDPVAAAYIDFPDIILEILENHHTSYVKPKSGSEETIKKRRIRDQKKHLLKNVFEKAQKAKRNKKRLKKLRDMLRFILSYDSSDPGEGSTSSTTNNDLERKSTCTSLKPNYMTYSGSLNNFYRAEVGSSHSVLSQKTLCEQEMNPTPAMTTSSILNSSENTSKLPCMCSTVAKNLKLASWISKMGGACYCRKPIIKIKRSAETYCDLDNSDFNVVYVDIETQSSRNVASKVTGTNITNNSNITLPDNLNETFVLREVRPSYNKYLETCVNHLKRCGTRNINTSIISKNEVAFLNRKLVNESNEKRIKNKQIKEHNFTEEPDILQSNAIKKAVLAIYSEQITTSGRMVAKLPKYVHKTENKLRSNLNAFAANVTVNGCK